MAKHTKNWAIVLLLMVVGNELAKGNDVFECAGAPCTKSLHEFCAKPPIVKMDRCERCIDYAFYCNTTMMPSDCFPFCIEVQKKSQEEEIRNITKNYTDQLKQATEKSDDCRRTTLALYFAVSILAVMTLIAVIIACRKHIMMTKKLRHRNVELQDTKDIDETERLSVNTDISINSTNTKDLKKEKKHPDLHNITPSQNDNKKLVTSGN